MISRMDLRTLNRVFVSWEEEWTLPEYVKRYLKSRRIAATIPVQERIGAMLASYKGGWPLTKADLDYFLDANLGR